MLDWWWIIFRIRPAARALSFLFGFSGFVLSRALIMYPWAQFFRSAFYRFAPLCSPFLRRYFPLIFFSLPPERRVVRLVKISCLERNQYSSSKMDPERDKGTNQWQIYIQKIFVAKNEINRNNLTVDGYIFSTYNFRSTTNIFKCILLTHIKVIKVNFKRC